MDGGGLIVHKRKRYNYIPTTTSGTIEYFHIVGDVDVYISESPPMTF